MVHTQEKKSQEEIMLPEEVQMLDLLDKVC